MTGEVSKKSKKSKKGEVTSDSEKEISKTAVVNRGARQRARKKELKLLLDNKEITFDEYKLRMKSKVTLLDLRDRRDEARQLGRVNDEEEYEEEPTKGKHNDNDDNDSFEGEEALETDQYGNFID